MLNTLSPAPFDPIMGVFMQFQADARPEKIDLGVGVYRDETGVSPVMRAVKAAETRLLQSQTSKAYVGVSGDAAFCAAVGRVVFGEDGPVAWDSERIRGLQTPGGCGALCVLLGLAVRAGARRAWVTDPTWFNHVSLARKAGLEAIPHPYLNAATRLADFDSMRAALENAGPQDVLIVHGCCHNPIGADLEAAHWAALAEIAERRGFLVLVDLAYQGFGQGLDEDAAGMRLLAARLPNLLVAVSCSKNFGIYRDRVGAAFIVGETAAVADAAYGQTSEEVRATYSMPPDHAASAVRIILEDAELAADWRAELTTARERVRRLRSLLAGALRQATASERYDYLTKHQGMFSLLDLGAEGVARLREDHAIYAIGTGRMNVAGLTEAQIPRVARAIAQVV